MKIINRGITPFTRIFVYVFNGLDQMDFVTWSDQHCDASDLYLKFIWKIKPATTPLTERLKNRGL